MQTIRDYIAAHRKTLIAAIVAVVVLVDPSATADQVSAVVGTVLLWLVPNDQAAVGRIYRKRK